LVIRNGSRRNTIAFTTLAAAFPTLGLWLRTARHFTLAQIAQRARLRGQRALLNAAPVSTAVLIRRRTERVTGWPPHFVPLDLQAVEGKPSVDANAEGYFEFLGERRHLGDSMDWEQVGAPLLWRFELNYFNWLWAFVAHLDRARAVEVFSRLWCSWKTSTTFGRGTAWAPYVASLRTWALCGAHTALATEQGLAADVSASIAEHAGFVRAHMEFDVGGNHLIKNLKALIGAAVFLGDNKLLKYACSKLEKEIEIQVLDDGGHYERSPSYHCQVLGDLIDIRSLLVGASRPVPGDLSDAIDRMRCWLGRIRLPDGDVPFFNDSVPVGPRVIENLHPESAARPALVVLPASGYVAAGAADGLFIVIDVGAPCPPELPAHAHSDCLSFELCSGSRRVLVNSGISTYEPGARRAYERSTRAHNTLEIDRQDQTETWATFRAGRRANALLERCREVSAEVLVIGSHDGYSRLPGSPIHRRSWSIGDDLVCIKDEIAGRGYHEVASWLHFSGTEPVCFRPEAGRLNAQGMEVRVVGDGVVLELVRAGADPEGWVARGFGRRSPAPAFVARVAGQLPLRLVTTIKTGARAPTN
jgi:uncharacterized heparinase superfamily protein